MKAFVKGKIAVMKNEFDPNRHVLMHVDTVAKKVDAYIMCEPEEFAIKFHKTIRALGKQFSGYTVEAVCPLAYGHKAIMTARIH